MDLLVHGETTHDSFDSFLFCSRGRAEIRIESDRSPRETK